jgi:hypothetical protein
VSEATKPKTAKKAPARGADAVSGSREARRAAAVVLEVLAGLRKPMEAAKDLGITVTHYYVVETRGLQGLVTALEPVPRGKKPDLKKVLERASREKRRLEAELSRSRTLLRMAQRAIGIPAASPLPRPRKPGQKTGDGRKGPRRPQVRARKAIEAFRKVPEVEEEAPNAPMESA